MSEEQAGAGAQARAGTGTTPEPVAGAKPAPETKESTQSNLPWFKKKEANHARRPSKPDLTPDLERLANVGKPKLVPDRSSTERFLSLSRQYKKNLLFWLWENEGRRFRDPDDIWNESSWYAGCSPTTAKRWIGQFTSHFAPFRLTEGQDYWILEMRKKNGGNGGGKA